MHPDDHYVVITADSHAGGPESSALSSEQVRFAWEALGALPARQNFALYLRQVDDRVIEHGDVRIEILTEGDEHGQGLVRTCTFPVPKYLLSGGVGRSWECVTEVRPNEYSRYEAVGKPLQTAEIFA